MLLLSLSGLAFLPIPFIYLLFKKSPWYIFLLSVPFWMAYYTAYSWIVMFFVLGFIAM